MVNLLLLVPRVDSRIRKGGIHRDSLLGEIGMRTHYHRRDSLLGEIDMRTHCHGRVTYDEVREIADISIHILR